MCSFVLRIDLFCFSNIIVSITWNDLIVRMLDRRRRILAVDYFPLFSLIRDSSIRTFSYLLLILSCRHRHTCDSGILMKTTLMCNLLLLLLMLALLRLSASVAAIHIHRLHIKDEKIPDVR